MARRAGVRDRGGSDGSGHEKRNVNWSEARGRWDVASGLKKQAQIDEQIAFFRARRGKAYGFRFKNWADYKATFSSAGSTAAFALSSGLSFAAGDRLSIVNEDPADATRADVSLTVKGQCDEEKTMARTAGDISLKWVAAQEYTISAYQNLANAACAVGIELDLSALDKLVDLLIGSKHKTASARSGRTYVAYGITARSLLAAPAAKAPS